MLQLHLLGTPQVWLGQTPVVFKTHKALALLVYLVVEGGAHSREELVALLWPQKNEAMGKQSLRQALTFLRHALGGSEYIHSNKENLCFNLHLPYWLDLEQIKLNTSSEALQQAISHYGGPFLNHFNLPDAPPFEDWAQQRRALVQSKLDLACDRFSLLLMQEEKLVQAVEVALYWVQLEPLNELAYRRLIELQLRRGNRKAALDAFQKCTEVLQRELGFGPSEETQALAWVIASGRP